MNLRIGLIPDLRETAARLPGLMEQARREGFALSGAEITEEPLPDDQNAAVILEKVGESLWPYAAEFRALDPSEEARNALEEQLRRLSEAAERPGFRFSCDSDMLFLQSLDLLRRQIAVYHGIQWKLRTLNLHDPERTELALTLDQVAAWVGSDATLSMAELSCRCALAAREALAEGASSGQSTPKLPAWKPNLRRLIGQSILYTMGLRRCCRLPQLSRFELLERMPMNLAMRFDRPVSLASGDAVREGLPPDAWAQARAARELEMLLSLLPMIDSGAGAAAVFAALGQQARRMARSWRASEAGGGACLGRRRLNVSFVGQAMACRVH